MCLHLRGILQEIHLALILNYIPTLRGHQAFYTLRKNSTEERLWFSLFLIKEDQSDFNYYGGSLISSSAAKLGLGDCKTNVFFVFSNIDISKVLMDGPVPAPLWMEPMVVS